MDAAAVTALVDPATDPVGLARLAGRHLVTPMLAACTADPQVRPRLPEDFRRYLGFVHAENARRNRALRRQLGEAAAHLNRVGIEPVLLKGATRLVDGLYPDLGWRFMRDLDLLVPCDRLPDALTCLKSTGYGVREEAMGWSAHHKHLPPLRREGEAAVIEFHAEPLPGRRELCPAAGVLARSRLVDLDGARVRVPDAVDQLAHLVGHDRFDGYLRRSGMFLLRSLFETALLCDDEDHAQRLHARFAGSGAARWAWIQLQLAARLFPDHVAPLQLDPDIAGYLQVRAKLSLERLDSDGRLRRLVWFARLRAGKLLRSPAERDHLAANILCPAYGRRGMRRLRRLWVSD